MDSNHHLSGFKAQLTSIADALAGADVTLKRLRKEYTRLRKLYHGDVKLAPARNIIFRYREEGQAGADGETVFSLADTVAQTYKDKQVGKIFMEFHSELKKHPRFLLMYLMHEQSHLRNWRAGCRGSSEWWDRECVRLGALGAMREYY